MFVHRYSLGLRIGIRGSGVPHGGATRECHIESKDSFNGLKDTLSTIKGPYVFKEKS